MQQFLPVRKAFLLAALVFVFDFVLGTAVALQLNLSDPAIGGTARDNWFTAGTPPSQRLWSHLLCLCAPGARSKAGGEHRNG